VNMSIANNIPQSLYGDELLVHANDSRPDS
jgi:hypothetical protein